MNRTPIEWCDFTWNPVVGCSRGCEWCYARRQAKRMRQRCTQCYRFKPHLHLERLDQPFQRKTPAKIFVCSMGELFDPALPVEATLCVVAQIAVTPWHTFMVLTKRPDLMYDTLWGERGVDIEAERPYLLRGDSIPNAWLGVSVTNQGDADERMLALLECNAPVRFVSYEPAHGPVEFGFLGTTRHSLTTNVGDLINWLIIGAETGNRRDKVVPERAWIADAVSQAREAGVAVFVKDNVVAHFPEFAGIREWPKGGA